MDSQQTRLGRGIPLRDHLGQAHPTVVTALATCCALLAYILLAGYALLPVSGQGAAQDDRFAELTDYVPETTEIQTRPAPVVSRMPGLDVTATRWMAYRTDARDLLPTPDAPYRLHAVVGLGPHNAWALDAASVPAPDLLPPVPPGLYRYVPQHCTFTSVPGEQASQLLYTGRRELANQSTDSFAIEELVVSVDCNLAVVVGHGSGS